MAAGVKMFAVWMMGWEGGSQSIVHIRSWCYYGVYRLLNLGWDFEF